ncbi:hypothetical protein [Arenimonas sp.]|uniref:hypothetical protein n=1 Tax=Arenimonas sp. TaxID=1872635 RepID=UPI0025C3853C|nr:hypothetical protein [Arenimonas sp.]
MKERVSEKKFKKGAGFYAYGMFGLVTFVPPALAIHGVWLGGTVYAFSYVAYLLLGGDRFTALRCTFWLVLSATLYVVALINHLMGYGFRGFIEVLFVVFAILLMVSTLRVLRKAYLDGEFDP